MKYNCLSVQKHEYQGFSIVPIREEDRYQIMQWRNEQLYHLRQSKPLTKNDQDDYFKNVVAQLFVENNPKQILFSYLHNGICFGYGGLVHINWIDKNAEISFLMNTELESSSFGIHWSNFLKMIEIVAFDDLKLHKLFAYAFDLRPHLYPVLEKNNYYLEATLKEHCFFNDKFINVIIYSKLNRV